MRNVGRVFAVFNVIVKRATIVRPPGLEAKQVKPATIVPPPRLRSKALGTNVLNPDKLGETRGCASIRMCFLLLTLYLKMRHEPKMGDALLT